MTKLERIGWWRPAPADAADGSQPGWQHQRHRGRDGRGSGTTLAAGRAGPVAAVAGTLVGLGLAAACFAYQVRRFRRAAAVVPEPYEGQGPACPGDLPGDQTTRAAPGSRPRRPNLQPHCQGRLHNSTADPMARSCEAGCGAPRITPETGRCQGHHPDRQQQRGQLDQVNQPVWST
jgi:hypothetical protein